jgi:hypothetical protein
MRKIHADLYFNTLYASAICEGIRALLYPFHWVHVYLPVVPSPLLDLMEAPVPFMLGTHTNWLPLIPLDCFRDVVVVVSLSYGTTFVYVMVTRRTVMPLC